MTVLGRRPSRGPLPTGKVAVLGLGLSGQAAVQAMGQLLRRDGVTSIVVLDAAADPHVTLGIEQARALGAEVLLGADTVPPDTDFVIVSPGLSPASPLMRSALALGVPVISELELAWRLSRSPWVAVTGTNGKTTVTSLVTHLLLEGGIPAEAVGNIGTAASEVAQLAGETTVLVAEVSSFQLSRIEDFHPRVSVLLNITPDHLDWHGSMEMYEADKVRVFKKQTAGDVAVIDVDDQGSAPYADSVQATGVRICRVSLRTVPSGGAGIVDGILTVDGPEGQIALIPTSELQIRGAHNVSNALAAAAAAFWMGAPPEALRSGLRSFEPIAHRLQPVGVANGVEYVNDSKATNPDAVLKALDAFEDRGVVILLGGRHKGTDLSPLVDAVVARCRAAVLFGEAADTFAEAFAGTNVVTKRAAGLAEAVASAHRLAVPGDVVLLSPGCASFDEFDGYAARGRAFAEAVTALAQSSTPATEGTRP